MGQLTLYLGGAKSGKTRAALAAVEALSPPWLYLATAEALDEEMARRIESHRAERGPRWRTVEEPLDPAGALAAAPDGPPVLMDCLTLWLSNLVGRRGGTLELGPYLEDVDRLVAAAGRRGGPLFVVSNELGGGLTPMEPLGRFFRDLSGLAHQRLAAAAAAVWLVTAGLPMRLK
ncbi:MAG: bifunctional adenosylcobinamide kinase/adenosylcobinamide-phosphate guanylyltransferase [Deltaproteobacteria bacterium]|nr:bifunctional adenosylcobinamide kinase/adenosylcobinamide-phosphate guanylyltransferase [Deltaproteobacteria bacterium]